MIVNVTALAEPIKRAKNVLRHVGQATNTPVMAPMLVKPPLFLVIDIALTASAVFKPTRYVK